MSALARSSLKYLHQHERPQKRTESTSSEQQRNLTFTYFPQLPIEIRFKIWKLVAPEPRNIDVGYYESCADPSPYECFHEIHSTVPRVPQILHVNREARSLTLESYGLEFGLSEMSYSPDFRLGKSPQGVNFPFPGRMYMNWERDTICPLGVNAFLPTWLPELFEHPKIRNLALNVNEMFLSDQELRSDGCLNIHSLFGLPNLEEVIFYYSHPAPERCVVENDGKGFCMEFEDLNESFIVQDLCRMPPGERAHLSYLLAARKSVYKDFDVLVQKRKMREELVRKGEEIPDELNIEGVDRILERKRPVVRLAYLSVNGKTSRLSTDND